jgi:hypothetical protein
LRITSPFYPYLLGLYFVLFVFYENLGEVYLGQLVIPLLVIVLVVTGILLICSLIFRDLYKGAFVAAVILAVLFVHNGLEDLVANIYQLRTRYLLAVELIVSILLIFVALRSIAEWGKVNRILNLTFGVLLLITVGNIAVYGLSGDGLLLPPKVALQKNDESSFAGSSDVLPDVYYILTDAYARADILNEYFGYDNSGFIDFLEDTGFQVADQGASNYLYTHMVTRSVLNMDYIADEGGYRKDADGISFAGTQQSLNNRVGKAFSSLGYRIVTIRSFGHYIATANAEDRELDSSWLAYDDFQIALLETTLLSRLIKNLTGDLYSERERVMFALDEIELQAENPGPKLVMAHIMAPHHPWFFDRDGNEPVPAKHPLGSPESLVAEIQLYRDQVHYLNKRLRQMITRIIDRSDMPPIIIVQGDHGLRLTNYQRGRMTLAFKDEDFCPRELFSNLNAIYVPGDKFKNLFYDSISPVNTFRLVFDAYFNGDFGMLPDRTFLPGKNSGSKHGPASFIEVTDVRGACSEEWELRFREANQALTRR